jgi:hypothetical protein
MPATQTALIRKVERELAHYPEVRHEVVNGGRHKRMVFYAGEQSRFLTIPKTPSDHRAPDNAVRDFRKTMRELGARRLDILPGQRNGRFSMTSVARFSLNEIYVAITIGTKGPLIDRFKTKENGPAGFWKLEVRASPDLEAPPFIALKKVPQGTKGAVKGFYQSNTGGWRIAAGRKGITGIPKALKKVRAVDIELYQDNGDELVFKLPTGVLPTSYERRAKQPEPEAEVPSGGGGGQEPAPLRVDLKVDAPVPEPVAKAAPEPTTGLHDKPMILQFPKQTISVEQALMVLTRKKQQLGNNLRFTITEGGFLTAVHRIGH